jgi:hypothetical protein
LIRAVVRTQKENSWILWAARRLRPFRKLLHPAGGLAGGKAGDLFGEDLIVGRFPGDLRPHTAVFPARFSREQKKTRPGGLPKPLLDGLEGPLAPREVPGALLDIRANGR